jgi:hypothetical protein
LAAVVAVAAALEEAGEGKYGSMEVWEWVGSNVKFFNTLSENLIFILLKEVKLEFVYSNIIDYARRSYCKKVVRFFFINYKLL